MAKSVEPLVINGEIYYSLLRIQRMRDEGLSWAKIAELHNVKSGTSVSQWFKRNQNTPDIYRDENGDFIRKVGSKGRLPVGMDPAYYRTDLTDILPNSEDMSQALYELKCSTMNIEAFWKVAELVNKLYGAELV